MLIPNLSVLLAERRLSISKVSEDTHISRTTLTALAGHGAKGMQFDTLNTLCQYLKITPGELFIYRPFDLELACDGLPGRSTVEFTIRRAGGRTERAELACDAAFLAEPAGPDGAPRLDALRLSLSLPECRDPERAAGNAALLELLRALPPQALARVELELLRAYDRNIDPALAPDDYSPDVRWPWQ